MKFRKTLSIFSCLIFIFGITILSSCSSDEGSLSSPTVSSNLVLNNKTKSYYSKIGYFEISIDDAFTYISSDIVSFDDGSSMIKTSTKIELFYGDTLVSRDNFLLNANAFANVSEGKILSALKINDVIINLNELDDENLEITENTTITAVYNNFIPMGICVDCSEQSSEDFVPLTCEMVNDEAVFNKDNIIYIYSNNNKFSSSTQNDFESESLFRLTKTNNSFDFKVESPELNASCYLLVKNENNEAYLLKFSNVENKFTFSNLENFGIDEISITLSLDLTTYAN